MNIQPGDLLVPNQLCREKGYHLGVLIIIEPYVSHATELDKFWLTWSDAFQFEPWAVGDLEKYFEHA